MKIERWASGTEFYVECDSWVRLQFAHFFDPSQPMRLMPQFENLPRGFYFRVIALRGTQVSEVVHLPGGLLLKSSEGLRAGLGIGKEESANIKVRKDSAVGKVHTRVIFGPRFKFKTQQSCEQIQEGA